MGLGGKLALYLGASRAEPFEPEVARGAASALLNAALDTAVDEREALVSELAEDLKREGSSLTLSTVMAGALVERGAPGRALESALFPRLRRWLDESVKLLDKVLGEQPARDASGGDEVDEVDEVDESEWVGTRLSEERPWALIGDTYLAAVAVLGADPEARRRQRELLPALRRLEPYHPGAAWLRQLLDVLDAEPLLVIDVAAGRGLSGTMSGVASNFELFVLVADAASGDPAGGYLTLVRPPAEAVSCLTGHGAQDSGLVVECAFNAYAYTALVERGSLPEASDYSGSAHWIWGEGEPWEIPAVDGTRVLLIGPSSYARLIPAQRTYASLDAQVRLTPLSEAEVEAWLSRIVLANAN
ncbi:MAG: hypothetical protein IPI67_29230 [Myxococcales bacterium]|nr:hypothetical protein [Myxococcales bacterium]